MMITAEKDGQILRKKRKRSKLPRILLAALLLVGGVGAVLSITGYEVFSAYRQSLSLTQMGIQHLHNAAALLEALPKRPFDTQGVNQAQQEFAAAQTSFMQLDNTLKSLPGAVIWLPPVASRLSAASRLVPFAISASQAGIAGCQFLALLLTQFHDLSTTQGPGLTLRDLTFLKEKFQQTKQSLDTAVHQANQVQPSDLQLDPRLSKMFASFHQELPALQMDFDIGGQFLAVAPALLGVPAQASYLVEVLDSTELRPGGGFIGSYGIATISGGRITSAPITDSNLLDRPLGVTSQKIPYPAAYTWFDLAPDSWSFRDSNLDADFPTAAHYAEQTYMQEGGKVPIQGVIAITPALMQHLLALTGPIDVSEYHETVTAQNLIARIHYHQLDPKAYEGSSLVPSPDGHSSLRKHFTALLAEQFLARLHDVLPQATPKILQLLASSLHSGDLQLYFNSSVAEHLLQNYRVDGSIQSPPGDNLAIVDANISPNKANSFIVNTANDQVTIDAEGNALHHLILTYAWNIPGPVYGSSVYRDYLRIYAPSGSTLRMQAGWQPRGTSEAFGHVVWAGFFTLSYGQTRTITLQWTVQHAAKKDAHGWHYAYLLQKQAGAQWKFSLGVMLPSCAVLSNKWGGLSSSTRQTATFSHTLDENTSLGMDYRC